MNARRWIPPHCICPAALTPDPGGIRPQVTPFRKFLLLFIILIQGWPCAASSDLPARFQRVVILKVRWFERGSALPNHARTRRTIRQITPALVFACFRPGRNRFSTTSMFAGSASPRLPGPFLIPDGHAVIRGNVEYDRYHRADLRLPECVSFLYRLCNVNTLSTCRELKCSIEPVFRLLLIAFRYDQTLQSFPTLPARSELDDPKKCACAKLLGQVSRIGWWNRPSRFRLSSSLSKEVESVMGARDPRPEFSLSRFLYGLTRDHEGHATSDPDALLHVMQELDALLGRVWTAIETGAACPADAAGGCFRSRNE